MRSRWQSLFSLVFLVGIVIFIGITFRSGYFSVQHISCQTDQGHCPDYIQAELNNKLGSSLFFTDFYTAGERITQLAPFLAHFEITKQFPDTVHYTFTTAKPLYIFVDNNDLPWVIDEAGYIVATAEAKLNHPTVYAATSFPFQPSVRDRVPTDLHQSLIQTLSATEELNLAQAKITVITHTEARLELEQGRVALFSLNQALQQLTKLIYLLQRFDFTKIKEPVTEIDLRFNQVILRTASSSATPTLKTPSP